MTKAQRIQALLAQKEAIEAKLWENPTVCGVAVGYQYIAQQRTKRLVISIHVTQKNDHIDPQWRIPSHINGIKTDIIEATFSTDAPHLPQSRSLNVQTDTARYTVLKGGIAIGLQQAAVVQQAGETIQVYEPGTLGAIVFDRSSHAPLLLSNYHVLAANGFKQGASVMQPSPADKGKIPDDTIAAVHKAVCNQWVDCAVAHLHTQRQYESSIMDIGAINGAASATVGVQVRKRGRTTHLSYGTIEQVGLSVKAQFMGKTLTFNNQLLVRVNPLKSSLFAAHGDSGAVVVDNQNNIVGLLSLIGKDGQTAIINPISAVMSALDIDIISHNPALLLPNLPLKLYAKGQRVQHLQAALNKAGYSPALSTDGVFGQKLLNAVKWFQAKVGLKPDGVVGQNTWNALGL
jgi:hypothetical protein